MQRCTANRLWLVSPFGRADSGTSGLDTSAEVSGEFCSIWKNGRGSRLKPTAIDAETWQQHAGVNRVQSFALLLTMAGFLGLLGWLLWGVPGVVWLVMLGTFAVWMSPSMSPRWVMRLYGASRVDQHQARELSTALAVLAQRAELPVVPELYYVPSRMLNAFAVGSPHRSAVAVTDGLLRQLEMREVIAVLAHEISHVRSNDLWVMGLADMFSRATSMLSLLGQLLLLINLPLVAFSTVTINWFAIVLLIFAPSLASLAQLALARTREYDADLNAARLTGDPDGLASALVRIDQVQGGWMERVFLPGKRVPEPSLLRTHPQTADRVSRLMALKGDSPVAMAAGFLHGVEGEPESLGSTIERPPRWHLNGLWH